MLIGYARVSTIDQRLDLQRDDLQRAGCERLYEDTITGTSTERPGLAKALDQLRTGDTLVVWKLDRLGRTTSHLLTFVEDLQAKGIYFRSLQDQIDTSTSMGRFLFTVFAALAQLERDILRERTNAGLVAARARGRKGGRPCRLDTIKRDLVLASTQTAGELAQALGVSKNTIYRARKAARPQQAADEPRSAAPLV